MKQKKYVAIFLKIYNMIAKIRKFYFFFRTNFILFYFNCSYICILLCNKLICQFQYIMLYVTLYLQHKLCLQKVGTFINLCI